MGIASSSELVELHSCDRLSYSNGEMLNLNRHYRDYYCSVWHIKMVPLIGYSEPQLRSTQLCAVKCRAIHYKQQNRLFIYPEPHPILVYVFASDSVTGILLRSGNCFQPYALLPYEEPRSMGVIRKKTGTRGTDGGLKYICDVCSADITATVGIRFLHTSSDHPSLYVIATYFHNNALSG